MAVVTLRAADGGSYLRGPGELRGTPAPVLTDVVGGSSSAVGTVGTVDDLVSVVGGAA